MINRKQILFGVDGTDDRTLLSSLCDKADKALTTGADMYSKFLSPREQKLAKEHLERDVNITFFGGYGEAERCVARLSAYGDEPYEDKFPICAVKVSSKGGVRFSHRDCLGSVLALGIKRETVGDIVIFQDFAIIFCHREICDYILCNLEKISKYKVNTDLCDSKDLDIPEKSFSERHLTVSSLRLDCVLSAVTGKSRAVSSSLIQKGIVQVNYEEAKSPSAAVHDGDVISVRGVGKMIISTDMGLTKKGRFHIIGKLYK